MGLLDDFVRDRRKLLISVLLIFLLAGALRLYDIQWSFSNNGIDEGVMLERSLMLGKGFKLYTELPCDQAPLAFYLGSLFGGDVVPLRIVVAAFSLFAIAASMFASLRIKDERAMLLTGLLLSLDFVFLRESRLFSLDALSSCFIAFAIPPFLAYIRRGRRDMLVVSGLFVGLSTATKLFGVLAFIAMMVYIALEAKTERKGFARPTADIVVVAIAAALPLIAFMVFLGPSEMIQGIVFNQSQRGFDPFLKLSIIAYFGLNAAYALPLVRARTLWKRSKETRFLLCLSAVVLAFLLMEPLVFLHHTILLSPALAILAGIVVVETIDSNKGDTPKATDQILSNKRHPFSKATIAILLVGIVLSAGFSGYGLALQKKPIQMEYADWLRTVTSPDDFVISGDPIISAYAHRMTPPEVVNVAYRQHPDLTLQTIERAIEEYNVSVVIICYRLNDIDGLASYLSATGFTIAVPHTSASGSAVLDLFQNGLGPVTVYVKSG